MKQLSGYFYPQGRCMKVCLFQVNCLGDFVATLPLIDGLKRCGLVSELTVVTSLVGEILLRPLNLADRILSFDQNSYWSLHKRPFSMLRTGRLLSKYGFDVVISVDDERSVSAILAFLSGASERIGFDRVKNKGIFLYNHILPFDREVHVVTNRFGALRHLIEEKGGGGSLYPRRVPLAIDENCWGWLRTQTGANAEKYVVLHPYAKFEYQCWPEDRFVDLARSLLVQYPDLMIFVVCDLRDPDWGLHDARVKYMRDTTLEQLIVLIDQASLFIGNNSGPMNIAINQEVKTIVINGPSAKWWYDPWDDGTVEMLNPTSECRECDTWGDQRGICVNEVYLECMLTTSVADVLASAASLIGGTLS